MVAMMQATTSKKAASLLVPILLAAIVMAVKTSVPIQSILGHMVQYSAEFLDVAREVHRFDTIAGSNPTPLVSLYLRNVAYFKDWCSMVV